MGGWMAHEPELAERLAINALPEPWRRWCDWLFMDITDVPRIYQDKAWNDANIAYGELLADEADSHRKARKERV